MQTKERHTEYMREWRLKNPTKVLESSRKFRKLNPEKVREYTRNWKRLHPEKMREYRKADGSKFLEYKSRAKASNLEFSLTKEEFGLLRKMPCHYCGLQAGGIDRKDNKRGYARANSLPCCWRCNRFKGSMTYIDFIQACRQISDNHIVKIGQE